MPIENFARGAGASIKPGVERSGTPGSLAEKGRARNAGDSSGQAECLRYRTLRALCILRGS